MLEARGLTKYYSAIPAVRDVSFRIAAGGVLGILGPNGSGKSTTVSIRVARDLVDRLVVCSLLGQLLAEVLVVRLCKVPFTCAYLPRPIAGHDDVAALCDRLHDLQLLDGRPGTADAALSARVRRVHRLGNRRRAHHPPRAPDLAGVRTCLRFAEDDPDALFDGFHLSEGLAATPKSG